MMFTIHAIAQEQYNMEYKYKKGKTYRYKTESNLESNSEMMGQEVKSLTTSMVIF